MENAHRPAASLARPALGTVLFVLFVGPGPVVGLVPYALSGWQVRAPLFDGTSSRWLGAALLGLGVPLLGDALVRFVRQGRGTPAPVAPPARLVVTGPYRHVRNPMYLGVVAMILGQALLLGSRAVLVYGGCAALAFHLFVVLFEEPDLRARFGAEYLGYCRQVRRWVPRLTPAGPSSDSVSPAPTGPRP